MLQLMGDGAHQSQMAIAKENCDKDDTTDNHNKEYAHISMMAGEAIT